MEQQKVVKLNPHFQSLWNNSDRFLILYGSRSSSKSDFIATQIVSNLMTHEYYSLISVRKTYESIMESSFKTLVEKIESLGLSSEFTITKSPMKIVCKKNNNQVIFRGMDDMAKLKSIKDPSAIHFEEDVPDTYEEYLTISLSLRGSKSRYLQEIFTINPVIDDYENHWFWKRFFSGQNELSFRTSIEDVIDGKVYKQYATVHQSTWRHNTFLSPSDRVAFKALESDPVQYQQQSLGLFCNRVVKDQFYKRFDLDRNTYIQKYNPEIPLHLSFDFNSAPYNTCVVFQGYGKRLYQINEFCLKNPDNSTKDVCAAIRAAYPNHKMGMYIYGDRNGKNSDTRSEKGGNDYVIIFRELSKYKPEDRVASVNPNVRQRGNFINEMFMGRIKDAHDPEMNCELWINPDSKHMILDLLNVKEHPDGAQKLKEKYRDKQTGQSYEKYGHCSDSCDYCVTKYFAAEYTKFLSGGSGITFGRVHSKHRSKKY